MHLDLTERYVTESTELAESVAALREAGTHYGGEEIQREAESKITAKTSKADHTEAKAEPGEAKAQPNEANAYLGFPEASDVHSLLTSLHIMNNEVRLGFLDALMTLYEGRLFVELGYASITQYCDREFGIGRSTTYEYLRTAKALAQLPRLRIVFAEGVLSWYQVREIAKVASVHTEIEWMQFALECEFRTLEVEVAQARRTGRDAPRDKSYGLPDILVRVIVEMTLEQKERFREAMILVDEWTRDLSDVGDFGPECGESDDHDRSGRSGRALLPPLVRLIDAILSGAITVGPVACRCTPAGRRQSKSRAQRSPAQSILYRTCPNCLEATLQTEDGLLRIPPERIAALAAVSNRIVIAPEEELEAEVLPPGEIDKPNSAALSRKVLARDGGRCANPGCGGRRNPHAHHIVWRVRGGPTKLCNEVAVCEICHSLLHKGLLDVSGSHDSGLVWTPRPRDPSAKVRDIEYMRARIRELDRPDRWRRRTVHVSQTRDFGLESGHADEAVGAVGDAQAQSAHVLAPADWLGDNAAVPAAGALPESATADFSVGLDYGSGAPAAGRSPESAIADSSVGLDCGTGAPAAGRSPESAPADFSVGPERRSAMAAMATAGGWQPVYRASVADDRVGALPRTGWAYLTGGDRGKRLRELTDCLAGLGFSRSEADDRIREAFATLMAESRAAAAASMDSSGAQGRCEDPTDENVLIRALGRERWLR